MLSVHVLVVFFFFKQKTAYEMRISDWSSDVCSSDLAPAGFVGDGHGSAPDPRRIAAQGWRRSGGLHLAVAQPGHRMRKALHQRFVVGGDDHGGDRKSVVEGKSVSVRVDLGGRRIIKKKQKIKRRTHGIK